MNTTEFPTMIDYGQSLIKMIEGGQYTGVSKSITAENFPPVRDGGKQEVQLVLIHFNRPLITGEVLRELIKKQVCPARIEELLTFGVEHPELQRQFPIIALGSALKDQNFAPWLPGNISYDPWIPFLGTEHDGSGRVLGLHLQRLGWSDDSRFLAIRSNSWEVRLRNECGHLLM